MQNKHSMPARPGVRQRWKPIRIVWVGLRNWLRPSAIANVILCADRKGVKAAIARCIDCEYRSLGFESEDTKV